MREALEYYEDFMPVTSHATEYIVSFICDFESWIEDEDIYSEYNLDKSCSAIKALGMTANDAATISSLGDVIKPYEIKVEFYTTR